MASYGKVKESAAMQPAEPKRPKKELRSIELRKAQNGGAIAEHRHNVFDGEEKPHVFGADEGHKLAAHIEKHLGIKMPGNGSAEAPANGDE